MAFHGAVACAPGRRAVPPALEARSGERRQREQADQPRQGAVDRAEGGAGIDGRRWPGVHSTAHPPRQRRGRDIGYRGVGN